MKDKAEQIILKAIEVVPDVKSYLSQKAAQFYCDIKAASRDPKEPGLDKKTEREKKLERLAKKRLDAQLAKVKQRLEETTTITFDDISVPEYDAELMRIYSEGYVDGIGVSALGTNVPYESADIQGILNSYAQTYVTEWLRQLDTITIDNIRSALNIFAQTPGTTMGNVIDMLAPTFGPARAERIAVTEVTRMYAEANQIYGQELSKLFPGSTIKKGWFTNADDRVCPICGSLDGQSVGINDKFVDQYGKEHDNPPAHVNCRCWTGTDMS